LRSAWVHDLAQEGGRTAAPTQATDLVVAWWRTAALLYRASPGEVEDDEQNPFASNTRLIFTLDPPRGGTNADPPNDHGDHSVEERNPSAQGY
jgi:hypothetical protein